MGDGLVSLGEALAAFANATATQSQAHIRPLHQYVAQRLVIEGGFHPDDVTPHPPLRVETKRTGSPCRLILDAAATGHGDRTILGGLKTKDVDVVVTNNFVGPCVAVSVKGTIKAFRNLTNRMEEAAGDCTNLHNSYPTLVYGFLHVLKANGPADVQSPNDLAIDATGKVVDSIKRYHDVISRLAGRRDVRNEVSRYEAVGMALVDLIDENIGQLFESYPSSESLLCFQSFFSRLYEAYDLRFVYAAPKLESKTRRYEWATDSPALTAAAAAGFVPRLAGSF